MIAYRQVMSYDTLRVVMMCLWHSLKLQGNHIITFAKQAHNIRQSRIHNCKHITLNSSYCFIVKRDNGNKKRLGFSSLFYYFSNLFVHRTIKHTPNTATNISVISIANHILLASNIRGRINIVNPLITIPRATDDITERCDFIID